MQTRAQGGDWQHRMRLPSVIRSRLELLGPPSAETAPGPLPLNLRGTTYTMAQEATVLDENYFAVGRRIARRLPV